MSERQEKEPQRVTYTEALITGGFARKPSGASVAFCRKPLGVGWGLQSLTDAAKETAYRLSPQITNVKTAIPHPLLAHRTSHRPVVQEGKPQRTTSS